MRNVLPLSYGACTSFENHASRERRTQERLKVTVPIHVRSIDPSEHAVLEAAITIDVNRHGLCFRTPRHQYRIGMALCVTFSYSLPLMVGKELVGTVVRVDTLPNGGRSVAVQFVSQPELSRHEGA
jgi:hypothetical protein